MIEGALIAVGGIVIGWVLRSLPARRRRQPATEVNRCECGHPFALHDPQRNACHAVAGGSWWRQLLEMDYSPQCQCRRYVGPEPLPPYTAYLPTLPPPEDQR